MTLFNLFHFFRPWNMIIVLFMFCFLVLYLFLVKIFMCLGIKKGNANVKSMQIQGQHLRAERRTGRAERRSSAGLEKNI